MLETIPLYQMPVSEEGRLKRPTADRLKALLRYDPDTGSFWWIAKRNGTKPGQPAGTPNAEGRRQIRIDGSKIYAAHLAWLYMTGEWPDQLIDHKNRINSDDRWENLRLADRSLNGVNVVKVKPKRPDLPRGVTEHPGGFCAKISIRGKRKHLGLFKTPDEASAAYLKASAFRSEFLP